MAIQNFIFGGDAIAKTPEELAKQRAVIHALQANSRAPRNVGEGLNALGDGIVANVLNRRANRAQTEGRESAASVMEGIFGGMGAGSSSPVTTPTTSRPTMADAATSRVGQAHSGVLPSSFYDATNRTEGAGDYDTLFGHSQKEGPFAGTRVSQMTIGDALAFANPSGAYGQHVKGKVGRVATPMGAHQIVGTTLRNAAKEMGLDPSTPFNAETQDMIAGHLARKRLQGANTMQGKIAALRSEWEGFKNIPDAQMMQIINDLETMPAGGGAVAANEAMATGQMAGGPKIIDPGIIGGAADGPPDPNIAPEWKTNPSMAGQQPAAVQPTQLPPITATATEPMAMQQPAPQQAAPMPQVPPQAAPQAPAGFPMEEMAGMNPQFLGGPSAPRPSVAQALAGPQGASQQQGGQPSIQQLMQASANPWLSDSERQIVNALLQREMDNADPMHKLEMERAQLEIEQMRNPQPEQTAEMQNLQWRAEQAGLQPGTPEYQQFVLTGGKQADQTNVTVNTGEGDKFYETLDAENAKIYSGLSESGVQARSKLAQIDRLDGLLARAPQGAEGVMKQAIGEWGLNTEGLSDIQAAQALINELVPQQRQPGSGPMSDADLALFKQSLPRLINQPGGNQMIINTMRGIAEYQTQMGQIADKVADRTLTPAQAREQIRNLANPLAGFSEQEKAGASGAPEGVDPDLWQEMTPEERALWN